MANIFPLKKPDGEKIAQVLAPASTAFSIGDLIYMASGTYQAARASSQADKLDEPANQAEFALRFIGISNGARLSTDTVAGQLAVQQDGIVEYPCQSSTFEIGDLVGAAEAASGTALEDQLVKKVTNPRLAIGVVTKREASAVTKVQFRLLVRYMDVANRVDIGPGGAGSAAATALADTAPTLTVDQGPFFTAVPTAGRIATLPAVAQSKGLVWFFQNNSAGANSLTIKNAAAATIAVVPQNKCGIVWCDGAAWYGGVTA